ncbi:MAG: 6-phosphogluconate dehydrogenase-like protein [Candidatus Parcubacteria bacterium]|jgi:6-phosphogluconate dehydrogenase
MDNQKKELGFIGLGRMGFNMSTQLAEKGYRVVGVDSNSEVKSAALNVGIEVVADYQEMINALTAAKVIWLMVPSKFVDDVLNEIIPLVNAGDTIIDGGNSFYQDSLRRHKLLAEKEINFLDVGVSGGMSGARFGASLMIGGSQELFNQHEHIFSSLAAADGYARVGNAGAGHFVKMVHNGIEYGMMGAVAEGINVLHENSEKFGIDIKEVFKPYEHESIITSKLVTWLRQAYDDGQIDLLKGEVPTGETEFEMEHITTIADVKILTAALEQRKATRVQESYIGKLIAAMRNQFGGHKTIAKE